MEQNKNSRRSFLKKSSMAGLGLAFSGSHKDPASLNLAEGDKSNGDQKESIIDIHQHIFYHWRTDDQMIEHQKNMGVDTTILLPAGSPSYTESTHYGHSNGLGGVHCGGNEPCAHFAETHSKNYLFAACEVPDIENAVSNIEKYLKRGAKMIAEVKFALPCDSLAMQKLYKLAADYDVPILMHWLIGRYNMGYERFYKMLEKYPSTKFIGHAQTFWANIDKNQENHPWTVYPTGPITPGGLTDRYLSDYENMYGDLSAGSGRNAQNRDDEFIRDFYKRHQDKLMFGSDCADSVGHGKECDGALIIDTVKRLTDKEVERKLLYKNAKQIFKL